MPYFERTDVLKELILIKQENQKSVMFATIGIF